MINKVTLLGRIGKKETKTLKNGNEVTVLHVATTKKWMNSDAILTEETTWHTVNCFGKISELAEKYTHVGELIYLEGEIVVKKKEHDGDVRYYHSITCFELKFIPGQKKKEDEETKATENMIDDAIPF